MRVQRDDLRGTKTLTGKQFSWCYGDIEFRGNPEQSAYIESLPFTHT